jgi:predicted nucleic acid-binding protein
VDTSVLAGDVAPQAPGTWAVSVVTIGELEVGVLLAPGKLRAQRLARLTGILEQAPVLTVDRRVAAHYAQLRPLPAGSRRMTYGSPPRRSRTS